MGRRPYRQVLLFTAVFTVPAIMIAVQARTVAVQERALAQTQLEKAVKHEAAEIGQDFFTRLERIKTQEMANAPARPVAQVKYSDPAVARQSDGWRERV